MQTLNRMELVTSGLQADVYKYNDIALKLFKKKMRREGVEYEIRLQKLVLDLGVPVPKTYDIVEVDGRYGILMEYIDGISFKDLILNNKSETEKYLIKSIEIQIELNKIIAPNFPSQEEILRINIENTKKLDRFEKDKLLERLSGIEFDKFLCHGDFHISNLIETANGVKIIDWANASAGTPAADIYRTYLLYKIYAPSLSDFYLYAYCNMTRVSKESILNWAPIIAGARLIEGIEDRQEIEMLKEIVKKNI